MSANLVKRLRKAADKNGDATIGLCWALLDEAADEIEYLERCLVKATAHVCFLDHSSCIGVDD